MECGAGVQKLGPHWNDRRELDVQVTSTPAKGSVVLTAPLPGSNRIGDKPSKDCAGERSGGGRGGRGEGVRHGLHRREAQQKLYHSPSRECRLGAPAPAVYFRYDRECTPWGRGARSLNGIRNRNSVFASEREFSNWHMFLLTTDVAIEGLQTGLRPSGNAQSWPRTRVSTIANTTLIRCWPHTQGELQT